MIQQLISSYDNRDRLTAFVVSVVLAVTTAGCSNGKSSNATPAAFEFSNLRVEDIGATSAVVLFNTSLPSSCEVEYGLTQSTLDGHATDPSMTPGTLVLTHRVPLFDLPSATNIYYRARATDADLKTYFSGISSFQTETADAGLGPANVALRSAGTTIVEVSSNYGGADNASAYGADNAIDGEIATEWATNGDGNAAYVVLDFGQNRSLTTFGFRGRKMADGSSIITRVRVVAPELGSELGTFDTPNPDLTYSFDFGSPVSVRQVRIEAVESTGGNTGAAEIEFFE